MSLLKIKGLHVAFDGKEVVSDLSLSIEAGEKFALVGESGSGKTVSALSVLRLNQGAHYQGSILLDGEDILQKPERAMRAVRGNQVAMIFQEPMTALNPLLTIGSQIAEVLRLHEGLSARAAAVRTVELLDQTGIPEPARRANAYPHQLSGGQRQRAMIAMALACKPKLLIADEPTTALDVTIQVQIMELLQQLQRSENMAILMISHDLNLVRHFADRVGVMHHGRLVESAATDELFARPQADYTRALLASRPQRIVEPLPETSESTPAEPLLSAERLECRFMLPRGWFRKTPFVAVAPVDLQLHRGETLGIVGESGSGKSTLGLALLRLSAAEVSGTIRFGGQTISSMSSAAIRPLRARMQVVFQDPFGSLSPRYTVQKLIGEGLALHQPQLSPAQLRAAVCAALQEVGLPDDILERYPHEFSGGQRQRIAIARAVILKPELILLDEPTSSLDVSVQQQVLQLLAQLQRKYGIAYVLISHDLAVVRAMAHGVLVMKEGRVVESGATAAVLGSPTHPYTQQLLAAAMYSSTVTK
ncbi:dipeptide ABC transporter ATP-binding protein [Herbaspirillum sp. RTI4]|uniref:ABC transporter ATP-binding protein n=1 Tax=Herbaspirillum sp. RTI4 TaxID=3048640 RepID=UPI002AB365D3|nr:dipeptide ABC transporter ATP-binding protein [Herbaspirillum sp. RTI4]MDY7579620.1 dipeptide ABC transporter ATP-binding protein [Herbaspirillum sp. RTI4]MEA9981835.1 dipeptide ABC transporter ATP-binding protein [Herbaspirillum sp. RTI4]